MRPRVLAGTLALWRPRKSTRNPYGLTGYTVFCVPTVMRVGRPRGRTLSDLELQHLQLLLESRERVADRGRWYDVRLEDFVLQLREDGASAQSIADVAGVSAPAVQKWTQHARVRRVTPP